MSAYVIRSCCGPGRGWRVCCAAGAAVFLLLQSISSAAEPLTDDVLEQAARAWQEYQAVTSPLQGTAFFRTVRKGRPDRVLSSSQYKITRSAENALVVVKKREEDKRAGDVDVYGMNSRYAFRLDAAETGESETGEAWSLRSLDSSLEEVTISGLSTASGGPREFATKLACRGMMLYRKTLPELIREPGFSFESARAVDRDGERLIEVAFDYEPQRPDRYIQRGGTVLLDPGRSYLLREAELELKSEFEVGRIAIQTEYNEAFAEFPVISRYVARAHSEPDGPLAKEQGFTDPVDVEEVWEFQWQSRNEVPESEFTLSAYGLPEPELPSAGVPPWVWLAVAGVLLVILAAWLRRRYAMQA